MGGGDLNSKKSWHPNTMKNQERVWKAEQAVAEEKKRITELQRERAEERDRAELNEMVQRNAGSYADDRLNWMYDKPNKKVQEEDYLLGKSIDQNYGRAEKEEQSTIPAVARRVVGSSMLSSGGDTQVDLARKMREDPLLLVKERERAARAALLNNPLHRRRLADLLRKEQEQKKERSKKKSKGKGKDLDNMLAAKLNAFSAGKGIDIAKLLDSDDSSSDSSDSSVDRSNKKKKKKAKEITSKKGKKKTKLKKKSMSHSSSDSSDDIKDAKHKQKSKEKAVERYAHSSDVRSRKHESESDTESKKRFQHSEKKNYNDINKERKRIRRYSSDEKTNHSIGKQRYRQEHETDRRHEYDADKRRDNEGNKRQIYEADKKRDKEGERKRDYEDERRRDLEGDRRRDYDGERRRDYEGDTRRHRSPNPRDRLEPEKRKKGLSEEERAAKLAEMAAAGAQREEQRGRRVAEQRRAHDADAHAHADGAWRASGRDARALPDSLETRIRSNRHYIQRDRHHMNEHFARR